MLIINPALQAAGLVGTWDTDVPAGRSVLDEGAADLLAGDGGLAGQPMPLDIALRRMHPDDRGWVFDRIRRVRETGGSFSAEFRVLTGTGEVRWVLNRGTLAPDETGVMHGRGAYIDTTDTHRGSFLPDHPIEMHETDPLIVAADRCIAAHAAIGLVGDRKLQRLSDMMLFAIGRTLAGRTRT
ncbi:PAS domain-containing protein [Methylobacterium sp. E-066]|uniref:PAS domain-containing protein n=1 Tax=Methylobacterium sp. E-066 TaxID=2836584 RepID=UPI001FB8D416|nr:PAS domain-containing protein [Methylobacterium sp. E-066]MCJ2139085.1 PAS domain-containing protein [Methylobacterium sp. E-066]